MCKLCNTNRKPQKYNDQFSTLLLEFQEIVAMYTGEFSCKQCGEAYLRHLKHPSESLTIDGYILHRKLIPYHILKSIEDRDRNKAKKRKSDIFNNRYVTSHRKRKKLKCNFKKEILNEHIITS